MELNLGRQHAVHEFNLLQSSVGIVWQDIPLAFLVNELILVELRNFRTDEEPWNGSVLVHIRENLEEGVVIGVYVEDTEEDGSLLSLPLLLPVLHEAVDHLMELLL